MDFRAQFKSAVQAKTIAASSHGQQHQEQHQEQHTKPKPKEPPHQKDKTKQLAHPSSQQTGMRQSREEGVDGPAPSIIPAGFFTDKAHDLRSRGEKILDAADAEREFEEFEKSLDDGIKEMESKEAEEVKEEADEREEREFNDQLSRLEQLEQLRQRKRPQADRDDGEMGEILVAPIILPPSKRPTLPEEDDASDEEDAQVDWRSRGRAKR